MKHGLKLAVAALSTAGVLAACGASNEEAKMITVGTEATYPPFTYKEKGELTGYDIDVMNEVAKRAGYKVDYKAMDFKGLIPALDSERIDVIANQMGITDERKEKYAFSDPYTVSGSTIIVNEKTDDIKTLDDLKGKVVGSTQGSLYAKTAEDAGAKVKYYKGANQVLKDLEAGRVDAAMNDRLFVLTELKKAGYKVKAVGETFDKNESGFMMAKDSKYAEDFNEALAEMKKDGTLADIGKKYFDEDISQ
ncbi:transporter substrate-binding domain-containing protein [Exiguobacterium oxidotolerans]|uniref:Putative sulfur aminoacid ABC transporter (Binding lipoprotein) n=1 Tax=Exiguobacterium oxidotolerans TaxID=223958 RepID=A0A653I3J3_9BACL|nr:transporter substrate-binding domain-containing protein [Exiguobacterium oxidotolerans]VWX33268.1 putative sulfur aminoacid ABC transporter (binding lipoprotein) [Exiguobacterium oxidotolerans]